MKKLFLVVLSATFLSVFCFSQKILDPEYTKAFGFGTVIASIAGYPEIDKYDATQFEFKDKTFYLKTGDEAKLNFRVIYPQGLTEGKAFDKLKKEKSRNIKRWTADYSCWQLWVSHETDGRQSFSNQSPWPSKLTDVPMWSSPFIEQKYNSSAESKTWNSMGWIWESDLKSSLPRWFAEAKPGYKIYVIFRICYEYSVPGGAIENKWDDVRKKFVPTKSVGGIGYEWSDPIAACTVEITVEEITPDRFKDNGDGTVTDSKANLMWIKEPGASKGTWEEVGKFANECKVGNYSDWRLPTAKELEVMMKISKAKDKQYKCEWLNQNGFKNIKEDSYWSSDTYISSGQITSQKVAVDFRYKIVGGDSQLSSNYYWLVRLAK